MKIILIENVKGTGKKDEIKEVKDGFGTFLIKNKKAVLYSNKSKEVLNNELKERELEYNSLVSACKEMKTKLEKEDLIFNVKSGKDGKVFGSISSKMISERLKEKGYNVDKKKIEAENINTLGSHIVKINLHKEVVANLTVTLKGGE